MHQTALETCQPGATVVPIIISSDKTQLTLFCNKMAYPIYLTIGNISKQLHQKVSCQVQILMGYIPTTKLASISNKAAQCRALANLYHTCMHDVLGPISSYGETGLDMLSGDGVWRRCHPIFAAFISDYPEQTLVTCTYYGRCPKCTVPPTQLGEYGSFPPCVHSTLLDTYQLVDSDFHTFHHACSKVGMKLIYHPFWESLPLVDVFCSITPDILHQVHQGMVKHIISWVSGIFGASAIDAQCRAISPGHDIMLFTKGITLSCLRSCAQKDCCDSIGPRCRSAGSWWPRLPTHHPGNARAYGLHLSCSIQKSHDRHHIKNAGLSKEIP